MSVRAAGADTETVVTAPRLLLGRDRDLAELYALVDVIEDRGRALVVRGEAGIGKSALLAAARERALDRGVTVVSTTGALSEAQLAFAGLHQLLLPLLGRLDLLPDPPSERPSRRLSALPRATPASAQWPRSPPWFYSQPIPRPG